MSLINQVLRDLEDRRARETDGNPMMPAAGGRVSSGKRRGIGYLGVTLLAVLVGALGAWYGPWPATSSPVAEQAAAPTPEPVVAAQSGVPAMAPLAPTAPARPGQPAVQETAPVATPASVKTGPVAQASPAPVTTQRMGPAEPVVLAKAAAPEPTPTRADVPRKDTLPVSDNDEAIPAEPALPPSVRRRPDPRAQATARYAQALEALRGADPVKAEGLLREALALDARHVQARHALVVLLIEDARLHEAERLSRTETGRAWNTLRARVLLKRGETDRAVAELEAGLPGADADYRALLAALYQRQRRHADAVALYRGALTLRPTQAAWWAGLGISLEGSGDKRQAVNVYRRALGMPGLGTELRRYLDQRLAVLDETPPSQALGASP